MSGRPINNWFVFLCPSSVSNYLGWGSVGAALMEVGGWDVGALVLFGEYENFVFKFFTYVPHIQDF